MLELALAQFAVESLPPSIQISAQDIEFGFNRAAQPWDIEVLQYLGLSIHSHQFVAEAAMTKAVVNSEFASCEAFADLPIDPEFVTVSAQTPSGQPSWLQSRPSGQYPSPSPT